MTDWPSDNTWSSDEVATKPKMDDFAKASRGRDQYLKEQLIVGGHTHDGVNSVEIVKATKTVKGSVFYMLYETGLLSSGGGSGTIYFTDDGTSGGTAIFPSSDPPFLEVTRSLNSGGDGSNLGIGHNTSSTDHYYSDLVWDGTYSCWKLTIYNYDSSTDYKFWVKVSGVD